MAQILRTDIRFMIFSQESESCDTCTSGAEGGACAVAGAGGAGAGAGGGDDMSALPVPKAFADSRRSSAASAVSAASINPEK